MVRQLPSSTVEKKRKFVVVQCNVKICVLFTYSIQLSMQLDLLNGGLTFKSLTILSNTTCSYLLSSCFMFNHNKSVL